MSSLSLQQVFRLQFSGYASRHGLSSEMRSAAWCVIHCRTASMGGHVNVCPSGHVQQIAYNSCGHRCCPQCGWLDKEKWLAKMRERLLPVPHHHIVFTLPSQLRIVWQFNRRAFANLLFDVAQQTLMELLGDAKFLGARPGIVAALHTWNQQLQRHVHLHCIVTAGGLTQSGHWVKAKKSCLLPRKVLMIKFRGKFKARLSQAIEKHKIILPSNLSLERLIQDISNPPWNVKVHSAYRQAIGVATYLAKYLKSGPIKNSRLIKLDQQHVVFRHRESTRLGGDGKRQVVGQLPIDTFIGRWLQHVPPKRLQTVRGYGLYSGNQHSKIELARQVLGVTAEPILPPQSWQQWLEQAGLRPSCCCPVCGKQLIRDREIAPTRPPPRLTIARLLDAK